MRESLPANQLPGQCALELCEQPIHLALGFVIQDIPHRPTDDPVLEYILLHQQVLLNREKRIQAALHRNN